jgi:hypothetical protein
MLSAGSIRTSAGRSAGGPQRESLIRHPSHQEGKFNYSRGINGERAGSRTRNPLIKSHIAPISP